MTSKRSYVARGALALLLALAAGAGEPVKLEVTPVEPARFEKRENGVYFADFGQDAFGGLRIEFPADPSPGAWKVRLGEKLGANGAIDRNPGGSVSFREVPLAVQPGRRAYQLDIPPGKLPRGAVTAKAPGAGEIAPFRYAEIEGPASALERSGVRQLFVHAPFDENASGFECADETLNAVWKLCKHTIEAATAFGVYIDGDRERTPYEADAYIAQLTHYACDLDPRVARATFEYLLKHPTWPTEWSFHMPMIAAEDYEATGDPELARDHYEELKGKLLTGKARGDGLLRAGAIVDWPAGERDGYNNGRQFPGDRQLGPEYNTVVNAFYYHALGKMALLARALNKEDDARDFEAKAKQVYEAFNRVFFDPMRGVYTDGEGGAHASLHANMFALAFGLAPEDRVARVADFVQSRGMACSVYGAQYLLEGLFKAGRDGYAVQLMASKSDRSWGHMLDLGSTMTLEAWDPKYKNNLTWNHAWGAAPANILSRFVLGVRPLEPGSSKILVAPQPGGLKWVRGKVPTAIGPVSLNIGNGAVFRLEIELPPNANARIVPPRRLGGQVWLDGKPALSLDGVRAGRHVIESR